MTCLMLTGDVAAMLAQVPDDSFDAVLCDPPYGLSFMDKAWDYDVPTTETWAAVLRVCKPGAALIAFFGPRTYHRGVVRLEDAGWEIRDQLAWMYGQGFPKSLNLEGDHDGYGTALKPAFEPAVLARKPLDGTVAVNVARWGCGALAIDACRIAGESTRRNNTAEMGYHGGNISTSYETGSDQGRWPANVMLDEVAAAAIDAQTGISASNFRRNKGTGLGFHGADQPRGAAGPDGSGGASRFFYCAKVSKAEREAGCGALEARSAADMTGSQEDAARLDSTRTGAGRGSGARNHHPTLKPLALTRYLAGLIKPPKDGAILVPFAGAGSEVIGAMQAGWAQVIGIERDPEYVAIAQARIAHWFAKQAAA